MPTYEDFRSGTGAKHSSILFFFFFFLWKIVFNKGHRAVKMSIFHNIILENQYRTFSSLYPYDISFSSTKLLLANMTIPKLLIYMFLFCFYVIFSLGSFFMSLFFALWLFGNAFFLIIFFLFVVDFVIHWNETAMGLHVFPTCKRMKLEHFLTPYTPVFLPGESPWTEEPGGLQSMGSQRVG